MSDLTSNPVAQKCIDAAALPTGLYAEAAAEIARLTARNAELVKALEEAQRDAERYRWLREWRHRWEVRYWTGTWWDSLTVGGLDMAIDAALKGDATP